jgi:hypothetical protein
VDFGGLAPEFDSAPMYSGPGLAVAPTPSTIDTVGVVGQTADGSQAPLSQAITTLLQSLASPSSSASSGSALAGLISDFLTMSSSSSSSSTTSATGLFGGISGGSILQALISDHRHLPGFFDLVLAIDPAVPAALRAPAGAGNAAAVKYGGS